MGEQREKTPKKGLREQIKDMVQEMDIPLSAVLDMPRMELSGDAGLMIERHRGMILYSDTMIKVAAKNMVVTVTGSKLELLSMNKSEMNIGGVIRSVGLQRTAADRGEEQ